MQLMSNARMQIHTNVYRNMFFKKSVTHYQTVCKPKFCTSTSDSSPLIYKKQKPGANFNWSCQCIKHSTEKLLHKIFSLKHPLAHKNLNTRHQVVPSTSAHCWYYGW